MVCVSAGESSEDPYSLYLTPNLNQLTITHGIPIRWPRPVYHVYTFGPISCNGDMTLFEKSAYRSNEISANSVFSNYMHPTYNLISQWFTFIFWFKKKKN